MRTHIGLPAVMTGDGIRSGGTADGIMFWRGYKMTNDCNEISEKHWLVFNHSEIASVAFSTRDQFKQSVIYLGEKRGKFKEILNTWKWEQEGAILIRHFYIFNRKLMQFYRSFVNVQSMRNQRRFRAWFGAKYVHLHKCTCVCMRHKTSKNYSHYFVCTSVYIWLIKVNLLYYYTLKICWIPKIITCDLLTTLLLLQNTSILNILTHFREICLFVCFF